MRKLSRRAASIALAAAMLFTTAGVSQKKVEAASTGKLSVTGYQDYSDAQKILKEVNKYRKKNGRKALKMDRGLTNSTIMRGFETTIYIPETSPHRRPNGKLSKSINKKIIYENCAQSGGTTPKQIVKGWINSSTHSKESRKIQGKKAIYKKYRDKEFIFKEELFKTRQQIRYNMGNRKNADEANISRQNDERVRCVSNSDQYIIFHIMEE